MTFAEYFLPLIAATWFLYFMVLALWLRMAITFALLIPSIVIAFVVLLLRHGII